MPNHKYSKLDEKIKPWQIENAQRKNIVWFFKKAGVNGFKRTGQEYQVINR